MEIGIVFWFLCGVVAAMIGARKGQGCLSFIVGVLLGPFGILIALFSKGNRLTCPYCKELVHRDASICKHCGKNLVTNCPNCRAATSIMGLKVGKNRCWKCKKDFTVT